MVFKVIGVLSLHNIGCIRRVGLLSTVTEAVSCGLKKIHIDDFLSRHKWWWCLLLVTDGLQIYMGRSNVSSRMLSSVLVYLIGFGSGVAVLYSGTGELKWEVG